jgi:hypothetical protein
MKAGCVDLVDQVDDDLFVAAQEILDRRLGQHWMGRERPGDAVLAE